MRKLLKLVLWTTTESVWDYEREPEISGPFKGVFWVQCNSTHHRKSFWLTPQ